MRIVSRTCSGVQVRAAVSRAAATSPRKKISAPAAIPARRGACPRVSKGLAREAFGTVAVKDQGVSERPGVDLDSD